MLKDFNLVSTTMESHERTENKIDDTFYRKLFLEIGTQIGDHFTDIGIHLDFTDDELKNIQETRKSARLWGYDLLTAWKKRQSPGAPLVDILCEVLREANRLDLAGKVKEYKSKLACGPKEAGKRCYKVAFDNETKIEEIDDIKIVIATPENFKGSIHFHLGKSYKEIHDVEESQLQNSEGNHENELENKIYAAMKSDPKLKREIEELLAQRDVKLLDTKRSSIVFELKVIDQQRAVKLIEDFHSGDLIMELVTVLIPEDVRMEFFGSYIEVTLTIDDELVQECLSQDKGCLEVLNQHSSTSSPTGHEVGEESTEETSSKSQMSQGNAPNNMSASSPLSNKSNYEKSPRELSDESVQSPLSYEKTPSALKSVQKPLSYKKQSSVLSDESVQSPMSYEKTPS
ncbi:unnamed protein product, partial [Owenia fusiformis]